MNREDRAANQGKRNNLIEKGGTTRGKTNILPAKVEKELIELRIQVATAERILQMIQTVKVLVVSDVDKLHLIYELADVLA